MEGLLKQYSDEDIIDPPNGSMEVDVIGEDEVAVFEGDENGKKSEYLPRIYYEDAEYISTDDIGCRKSVYGFISNVALLVSVPKRVLIGGEPYIVIRITEN